MLEDPRLRPDRVRVPPPGQLREAPGALSHHPPRHQANTRDYFRAYWFDGQPGNRRGALQRTALDAGTGSG